MDKKKMIVKCPQCDTAFEYYSSESRPFCSEKCKILDLGGWLSEDYAIAGEKTNRGHHEENDEYQYDETLTH